MTSALVTGSKGGIGAATVSAFEAAGFTVSGLDLDDAPLPFATHPYAASKAGLIGLTRAMAATYAKDGIRCNVVCPGLIATPLSRRAQEDPAIRARLSELQPLRVTSANRRMSRRRRCSWGRRRSSPVPP